MLETISQRHGEKPAADVLFAEVAALTRHIRRHGLFNFMLSNGEFLFVHASTLLHYIIRQAPFGKAHLIDDDISVDFSAVTTQNDRVAVIATLPLTQNEQWTQLACDELLAFRHGNIVMRDGPDAPRYLSVEEGLAIARSVGAV